MSSKPATGSKGPRGEIAELSASLQSLCTMGKRSDKELRMQKRDVFKKVINYLTVGMDMSSLFPSMTSCANLSPDDIVLKKMLYLYITHYATQTPDLALLTINQLHKDCVDQDPLVRGLALRSLCSLRLSNFLEYVSSPVLQALSDRHPYVRRMAVMGVLKIWHVDKSVVESTGMLETVHKMLRSDTDTQVLANCITVLVQVLGTPEPLLERTVLYNLINKLKEFSDWGQCQVLELAGRYKPASEGEVYDLLNAMEDRLAAANSAVAMAATKAFLHLTLDMPATHQQVLERIKEPLKSVIGRDEPAVTYAVLANVLLLAQRAPVIFEDDYTTFYCRTHDPWYIKKLKMEILSALASSSNVYEVVNELTEYARDVVHPNMAREAVRAVGRIALAVPDVAGIVERLLVFLESACDAVVSEALVCIKDLLRRFPDMAEVVVAQVMLAVTQNQALGLGAMNEPQARAALLWILGQFGQFIPEAPYLLEPLVDSFPTEEAPVKLALLTAATQLFFKRPPECCTVLGALLALGLQDPQQDVHDRALLYYRLLRSNVAEAERIINPPLAAVMNFSEALTQEMRDTIFKEFNTLSVVYQLPSASFLEPQGTYQSLLTVMEAPSQPESVAGHDMLGGVDNSTNLLADVDGGDATGMLASSHAPSELDLLDVGATGTAAAPAPFAGLDLPPVEAAFGGGGGLDSLMGGAGLLGGLGGPPPAGVNGGGGGATAWVGLLTDGGLSGLLGAPAAAAPAAAAPAAAWGGGGSGLGGMWDDMFGPLPSAKPLPVAVQAPAAAELVLDPQAKMAPRVFQDKWKALPVSQQLVEPLSEATVRAMATNNHKDLCQHLTQAYIQTTASGGQPPTYKYYFYGTQAGTQLVCLVEMVVGTVEHTASVTFRSELPAGATLQFVELFKNCLMGFYR